MRTTIYIDKILLDKLIKATGLLCISKNELISILLTRVINYKCFEVKLYKTVKYQGSYPGAEWKTVHVDFEPVFYEKAQDLRRNFKFSVSWFISFAIIRYLDDIINQLMNTKNQNNFTDNYDRNFVYIAKMLGEIPVFITMLGLPEKKYLKNLLI